MARIPIEIHPKFLPLLYDPHSFANIYGGRGGMKSEQTHKAALFEAIRTPIRICNARETMSSIRDSTHKVLTDQIYAHGMAASQNGPFEIQERRILRRDGDRIASEFIFIGIREDVRDKKSLAGINLTIIEEAGKVSQDSWDVLVPTVMGRTEGSRLWAIWNPEFVTDPTYKLMILHPPTNTIHIHTSYLENPWLTETMRTVAEDCKRDFPEKYRHIWLGEPLAEIEGAIFKDELQEATKDGRICRIPYNRSLPVHTAWDLGFNDPTAIWFFQAYDGYYNFIDYLEDNLRTIADYMVELQTRHYVYGDDWVPHDAVDGMTHKKLVADRGRSVESLMRAAGRKVRAAPKLEITERINAARMMFSQCRFDEEKCADGIQQLRRYQWEPSKTHLDERGNPLQVASHKDLHNEASHAGTAFCTAAVGMKQPRAPRKQVEEPSSAFVPKWS